MIGGGGSDRLFLDGIQDDFQVTRQGNVFTSVDLRDEETTSALDFQATDMLESIETRSFAPFGSDRVDVPIEDAVE